jgi:hypothetical protein
MGLIPWQQLVPDNVEAEIVYTISEADLTGTPF